MTNLSPNCDNLMPRLAKFFGIINLIITILLLADINFSNGQLIITKVFNASYQSHFLQTAAANWMLLWYGISCASLVYCANQIKQGNAIGHKMFPAAGVAYLLILLMAYRWLQQPLA